MVSAATRRFPAIVLDDLALGIEAAVLRAQNAN